MIEINCHLCQPLNKVACQSKVGVNKRKLIIVGIINYWRDN
jgi:hypothetical protein